MAYTEFEGTLDHEQPGYVEFNGELDKPDSKMDKVKSTISRGIDAGLSMLTPKKSIADQAQERSASLAGTAAPQVSGVPIRRDYYNKTVAETPAGSSAPDTGIVSRVQNIAANDKQAQASKRTVAKALVSTEPVPEEGGFINSAGRTVGQGIKGAGQIGADFLNADRNNAVKQYGQAVIDANPTAVNSLEDIAAKPGTAVSEATGNAVPSMAGMVGARAVGQGITALAPFTGPAAPLVAAAGQVVSWLGPAAIAALPSYGGIRDKQILNDPKNEKDAKSIAIATMGAAAVGAIEQAFGPQQWALAAMTKEGRAKLAEKFAAATIPGAIAKGMGKGMFAEGTEELAQNPIEQLASFDNPTTKENIKDTLFGGAMGAIGGGVLGGGMPMIAGKPVTEHSDAALRYTAARGGERAKAAAKAELERRATQGEANNTPESTPEAVDRIIATGREKADETRAATPDALKSDVLDEENTPTASPEAPQQTQPEGTSKPSSILPEAPVAQNQPEATPIQGNANAHIVLPDNTSLPAQWDVVDADSVKASLKEGVNQPRDRSRAASDIQVQGIANNPDYRRLSDSPVMDVGAPVLSHDGLIVGGNGRFEGISRSYDQNTSGNYLAQLKADAAAKGIDPAKIDTMKKPVLVRRITQPFDTRKLAEASNSGTGMQYSSLELAKIDAGRMKNLHDLEVTDTGDIALTGANIQNVRHALSGYNAAELGALVDKDGRLSQEGIRRIRNAMLYQAYGNSPTLERIVESTDNDLRNISGALVKASGTVARVRADIKAGAIPAELDISHDLVSSVEELSKIRAMGMSAEQYFAQLGMFGGGLSEAQKHILLTLEANIRSQKKLVDFIKGYYEAVSSIDLSSGDMFGNSTPTKPELLKNAKERITDKQLPEPESKPNAKPDSKPVDEGRKQSGNNESSDASRKQDKPDFDLKKQSEAELKAAAEKHAAEKKKAEAAKKRLDDEEKKKREQKEIDDRQKSSADNFELGKSAVDSLAGQGDIFSQPVQKAPALDYDKIQKRPDTTERQLEAGKSAYEERLRSIVNRANGSLLGAALAKDFRERGGSELIGKTVKSPEDLAVLAQIFRDPRFETFRIFFTKQGKIVHHTGITSRLPAAVAIFQGRKGESKRDAAMRLFKDLAKQKEASGADGYYVLHNHPSGRATPSNGDKEVTKYFAKYLPGFKSHIVIDTNEYATIGRDGRSKVTSRELTGGYSKEASIPHDALKKRISSVQDFAEIGKLIQRKDGFFTVIGLSAGLDVVSIAEIPLSVVSAKNKIRLHAMLRMFARHSGATFAFVSADDITPFKDAVNKGVILDAVTSDGKQSAKAGAGTIYPDPTKLFGKNPKFIQVEEANNQTDTPAFKKWFGHSKVVDKAGKPLVVYHGTVHDVDKFDTSRLGETTKADSAANGFFFTSDTEIANGYSDVFAGRTYREIARRRAEAEKKAMLTNERTDWDAYNDLSAQLSKQDKVDRQARTAEGANVLPVFLSIQNPVVVDFAGRDYNENEYMQAIDQAKKNGNDGVIFHNAVDDPVNYQRSADIYVAFKPEQIKSAIGNNGNFDSANPLIVNQTPSGYLFQTFNAPEKSRLDDLIHALQDKHIDLKRVTEAIKKTGKQITDNINAYLQEELFHGRTATRVKEFIDKELDPLIKLMRVNGVKMADFEEYLWARHAEERNIQIAKINPNMPDGGSGMKTQDARGYLKNLDPDKKKLYEALAKRVDAINKRSRQVLVDYGLESQKTINTWESAYQHYVPLMREDMDHAFGNGTGQGFSVKGNASKRATGSKRPVVDILANIAQQREKNIIRGEKNRVATALVGLAKTNPNPDFWKVDTPPTIRTVNKTTGLVENNVDPNYKNRDNVVVARIPDHKGNIQERSVVFNERDERALRMAQSLKNLDVDQLGALLNSSSAVTRYFSAINTQYNPIFGIVNLTRDVQGAMLNLTSTPLAGKKAAVISNTGPALLGIYQNMRGDRKGKAVTNKWSQLWEEFQREGGKTGFRDMYANAKARADALEKGLDPDWWQKTKIGKAITAGGILNAPEKLIADKAVKPLFDWLSDYNDSMENAVRLAAYKTGLEQGLSKQQAASLAKNLTVNFNRKGAAGRQIGALYAFFNASVQGTARLAETVKGPAGKRIVAGGILLGGMQAMLLAIAGMGDDEPPEFVKSKSLIIPISDGKYLSVPMPLGFNVLPNLGRITADFAMSGFKDPGKRTVQMMDSIMDAFNPIGNAGMSLQTITPTAIDPMAALAENKDWTGKPIARPDFNALNPTPGFTRAKDSASAFSKLLSEGLNQLSGGTKYQPGAISPTPDQIDYLISQATGGVGREYLKAEQTVTAKLTGEDLPPHKVPLLGRFYGDTKGQGSQEAPFYENIRRLNGIEAEIKGRMKNREDVEGFKKEHPEWSLIGAANTTEKMVQELRKRSRDLDKTDKPGKAELKKQFLERRREIMTRFNERYKAAVQ